MSCLFDILFFLSFGVGRGVLWAMNRVSSMSNFLICGSFRLQVMQIVFVCGSMSTL
jgi:hypothetical protein